VITNAPLGACWSCLLLGLSLGITSATFGAC